jgi:L-alanine-DL-glutamate epimerase-like enolase superfamily enzyme
LKSDEDQTVEAYWVHIPIPHERPHTSDFGRTLSFDGTLVRIEDRLRPHRLGRSQGADRRHAQNQALTSMINEEFAPLLKGEDPRDITRLCETLKGLLRFGVPPS